LARSVSRVTVALSILSSVSQLFFFLVGCSEMILKGFGFVAFFAGVIASSFCFYLSCLVCSLSVVRGEWSRLFQNRIIIIQINQPTRCKGFSRVYYPTFICGSICFGRYPAHHQEHTTTLGASGSTFGRKRLERCWSWSGRLTGQTTTNNVEPRMNVE
jgi:hypothetical protein